MGGWASGCYPVRVRRLVLDVSRYTLEDIFSDTSFHEPCTSPVVDVSAACSSKCLASVQHCLTIMCEDGFGSIVVCPRGRESVHKSLHS